MALRSFYYLYHFVDLCRYNYTQVLACSWSLFIAKDIENNPRSKLRDKLGKNVFSFLLQNTEIDILCLCNFMVSCVYDIRNSVTNQCSLLHNGEMELKEFYCLYHFVDLCRCKSARVLPCYQYRVKEK